MFWHESYIQKPISEEALPAYTENFGKPFSELNATNDLFCKIAQGDTDFVRGTPNY